MRSGGKRANTWRRIADFARAIEAGKDPSALKIAAEARTRRYRYGHALSGLKHQLSVA